jgi:hypothetical protein
METDGVSLGMLGDVCSCACACVRVYSTVRYNKVPGGGNVPAWAARQYMYLCMYHRYPRAGQDVRTYLPPAPTTPLAFRAVHLHIWHQIGLSATRRPVCPLAGAPCTEHTML